jgi:hypothetical protein
MENTSTANPDFIDEVATTLESVGEIAALFRFHAAAGNRSYEFFEAVDSFLERIDELPPQTSVLVFRASQFPIRGTANDELIQRAKDAIPDGADWAVVRTSQITMGSQSWYHDFEDSSHKELENELRDDFCWGHPVAVGVEPDWHDSTTVISAVKPFDDGRVELGIY